jgi:hypothetical protein
MGEGKVSGVEYCKVVSCARLCIPDFIPVPAGPHFLESAGIHKLLRVSVEETSGLNHSRARLII